MSDYKKRIASYTKGLTLGDQCLECTTHRDFMNRDQKYMIGLTRKHTTLNDALDHIMSLDALDQSFEASQDNNGTFLVTYKLLEDRISKAKQVINSLQAIKRDTDNIELYDNNAKKWLMI